VEPLRVLVVAGDPLARGGLAALLAAEDAVVVAGRAAPEEDLAEVAHALQVDAIVWDVGWQREDALAPLSEAALDLPVVALVPDEEEAAGALAAGAAGALRRAADGPRIVAALAAVARQLTVVDSAFRRALPPSARPRPSPDPSAPAADEPPLLEELTTRELQVLRLLAEGLPNKTIALRLEISEHTVKFHVNSLLGKLGAGSRTEAVVRATRLGLILL
jgi:DNA-binding NarL/FixJ family response regulator